MDCQHLKTASEYTLNHVLLCATSKQFAFRGFAPFRSARPGRLYNIRKQLAVRGFVAAESMTKTTESSSLERPQHGAKSSPNRRQIEPKIASPRGQIEPQNGSKSSPKWGPQGVREGSWKIIGFCPLFPPLRVRLVDDLGASWDLWGAVLGCLLGFLKAVFLGLLFELVSECVKGAI